MKSILVTMLLLPVGLAYRTPCDRLPVQKTQAIGRGIPDTTPVQHPEMPAIGSRAKPLPANRWLNTPKWIDSARAPQLNFGDGHVYVLDFTAMWCGSCPATYPMVREAFKRYESRGIRVLFVTTMFGVAEDHMTMFDAVEAERAALPKYFAKHDVTEPVAIIDSAAALYRDYGDSASPFSQGLALPKLIVIDGDGVVRSVMTGWNKEPTERELFTTLEKLMPPRK